MSQKVTKLQKYISQFNECMVGVIHYIGNIIPDSFFAQHRKEIETIFDEEPDEPIAYFLEFVYAVDKFRQGILDRDESVMMKESFEDTIDKGFNKGLVDKYDKNAKKTAAEELKKAYIKKIFSFKESWKIVTADQKHIIENIMITCVQICDKYVIAMDKINKSTELKEKGKKHHRKKKKSKKNIDFDDISTSSSGSSKGKNVRHKTIEEGDEDEELSVESGTSSRSSKSSRKKKKSVKKTSSRSTKKTTR